MHSLGFFPLFSFFFFFFFLAPLFQVQKDEHFERVAAVLFPWFSRVGSAGDPNAKTVCHSLRFVWTCRQILGTWTVRLSCNFVCALRHFVVSEANRLHFSCPGFFGDVVAVAGASRTCFSLVKGP